MNEIIIDKISNISDEDSDDQENSDDYCSETDDENSKKTNEKTLANPV